MLPCPLFKFYNCWAENMLALAIFFLVWKLLESVNSVYTA